MLFFFDNFIFMQKIQWAQLSVFTKVAAAFFFYTGVYRLYYYFLMVDDLYIKYTTVNTPEITMGALVVVGLWYVLFFVVAYFLLHKERWAYKMGLVFSGWSIFITFTIYFSLVLSVFSSFNVLPWLLFLSPIVTLVCLVLGRKDFKI